MITTEDLLERKWPKSKQSLPVKNIEFCLTIHDRETRIWRIDFSDMARVDTTTY